MKYFLAVILLLCMVLVYGFDESELLESDEYIFGRGEDSDFEGAEQKALQNLIEQISVSVKSSFIKQVEELNRSSEGGQSEVELNNYASMVIETYSGSFLRETERLPIQLDNGKSWRIYKYIKKADKDRLFASRKQRSEDFLKMGRRNRDLLNINRALLDFYSGLLLISSHPHNDTIRVFCDAGRQNLKLLLTQELRETLNEIELEITSMRDLSNYKRLNVEGSYRGGPISNLQYRYFDGNDRIEGNIQDGRGVIDLTKTWYEVNEEAAIDLCYGNDASQRNQLMDQELKSLSSFIYIDDRGFDNKINLDLPNKSTERQAKVKLKENKDYHHESKLKWKEKRELKGIVKDVIAYIRGEECEDIREYFTDRGFEQFTKLINYGEVSVYEEDFTVNYLNLGHQVQVRSIPLVFRLDDINDKVVTEKLCLICEDDLIAWANFALEDSYINDAIEDNWDAEDIEERLMGINFMEYYKTIFSLKETRLIEKIYSDSANIFTGYVKRTEALPENLKKELNQKLENKIEIKKYTKTEYIDRLENVVFPNNKYINIQFRDGDLIRRSLDRPIYAIQMHQDYYSTTYSDQGYLLLFVDFTEEKEPKIFFRYWQPEKIGEDSLRALQPGHVKW